MDVEKLTETVVALLESFRRGLPKPTIEVGTVVRPTGMTVFDRENPNAEADFVSSGRISFTIITEDSLLLVLSKSGSTLRVLSLDFGYVGRVDEDVVRPW